MTVKHPTPLSDSNDSTTSSPHQINMAIGTRSQYAKAGVVANSTTINASSKRLDQEKRAGIQARQNARNHQALQRKDMKIRRKSMTPYTVFEAGQEYARERFDSDKDSDCSNNHVLGNCPARSTFDFADLDDRTGRLSAPVGNLSQKDLGGRGGAFRQCRAREAEFRARVRDRGFA